ncbi:MAG: S9 family peptidase [Caldilineaceae bacterium]|nr:S9 family peptidase [Caldilineaceae bacterium]
MSYRALFSNHLAQMIPDPTPIYTIPSPDGRWIARARVDPSTELLTWEIDSLSDQVGDIYPSGMAWTPDGDGFFYDRILPFSGGHGLYFHAVGIPQRQDPCVLYHAEQPDWFYQPHVSPDGRWLAVSILNGSAANRLTVMARVGRTLSPPYSIIPHFVGRYDVIHWQEDQLILRAVEPQTPNGCLIAIDLPDGARTLVLPERDLPLLDAAPLGEGWIATCLRQGRAELCWFDTHNTPTTIPLPGLGTVDWLESTLETPPNSAICNLQFAIRFAYTDFARPPQIYRWRLDEDRPHPVEEIDLDFAPADFVTRAHTIPSADGAPVPIFVAHRRHLPLKDCPTLLTAYGGMGHALTPRFSPDVLAWMEGGGVYVSVCARGGGEGGSAWQGAAVGVHKQRTFDDVLAAARWLIARGITRPARLGLWGVSNGGLTAGACLTQAPDLFGAVVIESGLFDMLRYPHLGQGRHWIPEYGNPVDPSDRAALAAYSPLHAIRPGRRYPPTLIVTHDYDPRVGAEHSLTFAQTLVAAQDGDAPIRLRVHEGSGHGPPAGGEAWLVWTEERLTFLAQHLGLGQ